MFRISPPIESLMSAYADLESRAWKPKHQVPYSSRDVNESWRTTHSFRIFRYAGPVRPYQSSLAQCATLCYIFDMVNRTTLNVSLTPELNEFLQARVDSGRYQTTSEVVREALRLLERQEQDREQSLLELKLKLQRAASQAEKGELSNGDDVFNEIRAEILSVRPAKRTKR